MGPARWEALAATTARHGRPVPKAQPRSGRRCDSTRKAQRPGRRRSRRAQAPRRQGAASAAAGVLASPPRGARNNHPGEQRPGQVWAALSPTAVPDSPKGSPPLQLARRATGRGHRGHRGVSGRG
eukprot:3041234-Pyramimonas_sp.AAC.3